MENHAINNLFDVVSDFEVAMLVTQSGARPHARPMTVARLDKEMRTAYLITDINSIKVDEISTNPHALLTFQGPKKFASVSGELVVVLDRPLIEEMWKEIWTAWFPKGKSDPNIALLKFTPYEGEFWDNAGIQGMKFVFNAVKAIVTGDKLKLDSDQHSKVDLTKNL
jgi:general stress protein 26